MKQIKCCFIILSLILLKTLVVMILLSNGTSDISKNSLRRKQILYWTAKDSNVKDADWFEKYCPVGNCEGTKDRNIEEEADAVVFHLRYNNYLDREIPRKRSPSQIYVAWIHEHADFLQVTKRLTSLPKDYINTSMTYRLDSYIVVPYISTHNLSNHLRRNISEIYQNVQRFPKKKMVAWFVSHCKTSSDRESYVKELQKYIDVGIYGACGPLTCGRDTAKNRSDCYSMLEQDYKFYLSFENSICKDYVTEKLGNILRRYIVPVTLGGANYSQVAPLTRTSMLWILNHRKSWRST